MCSRPNFSKSVNSFGPAVFFSLFSRMWLSFGGAKSQNEFAAPELVEHQLPVMVSENFGKPKFHGKCKILAVFGL